MACAIFEVGRLVSFSRHADTTMDMTPAQSIPGWVPGVIVSAILSVIGAWRAVKTALDKVDKKVAVLEARHANARRDDRELSLDLKDAIREIRTVATDVKVIVAEQSVINKVTANTLDSITKKLDVHDHMIAEHAQQLMLMRELMTGACKPSKPCWKEGEKPDEHC